MSGAAGQLPYISSPLALKRRAGCSTIGTSARDQ